MKKNNNSVFRGIFPYKWYYIGGFFKNIKSFFRAFKMAYQRIKYGYCDNDRYSIRDWFLSTVPNMLREYGEKTVSYCTNIDEVDERELKTTPKAINMDNISDENKDYIRWKNLIFAIAEHFENSNKQYWEFSEENKKEFDELFGGNEDPEDFFVKINEHSEERDRKFSEYFEKEKEFFKYTEEELDKGMELFHKYFWDLWD